MADYDDVIRQLRELADDPRTAEDPDLTVILRQTKRLLAAFVKIDAAGSQMSMAGIGVDRGDPAAVRSTLLDGVDRLEETHAALLDAAGACSVLKRVYRQLAERGQS